MIGDIAETTEILESSKLFGQVVRGAVECQSGIGHELVQCLTGLWHGFGYLSKGLTAQSLGGFGQTFETGQCIGGLIANPCGFVQHVGNRVDGLLRVRHDTLQMFLGQTSETGKRIPQ